ncbi:MAG: hypothetical protein GX349_05945 [Firmicutes bacterium]|nr:hypothetical protein [Bacillota bacterium]
MMVNMDPTLLTVGGAATQSASPGVDGRIVEGDKLLAACQDFEAIFWHQVLRQMRRSIPKSGLLDGGMGEDVFQDFLDEEYSRLLARQGDGSLAHMLYEQLKLAR